ncbi:DUF2680 domain-containing protein [Abyssisolibacter fermentans]|uniref:DUF2680 domain-containing protein n=1 Tax=Abyssisolibacter fermentans TaxID=1766203 RepID=UPI00082E44B8|nr:DUF2680 domain-containing protein [Abyssisolibacter fermentans]
MKKLLTPILIIAVLVIGATTVLATSFSTPAEIVGNLTGKTSEEVYEQHIDENKTFGQIAAEEDKLDEFKDQMLENKKAIIEKRVEDGALTQEQADQITKKLEEQIANCDGNGTPSRIGCEYGVGFGRGLNGNGQGQGKGNGIGRGNGKGAGRMNGNGMGFNRNTNK